MKLLALVCLVACAASAFALLGGEQHVLSDDIIKRVNRDVTVPWLAGRNSRFEGKSIHDVKAMLGTKLEENPKEMMSFEVRDDLPKNFDSRTQWPGCVHPILNQERCGSCWAFGATEALSDRFCIASNKKVDVVLSPQSLVSCNTVLNHGCNGGIPRVAWEYMEFEGVLTLDCFPYTSGNGTAPQCQKTCDNGDAKLYKVAPFSVRSYESAGAIQKAIYEGGPVEGAFSVYQDFIHYKSGVYRHTTGSLLGGHAIKIIGWGHDEQSGLDYWTVANSWGTEWGEQGFFKIERGVDMCGIDHGAVAGKPAV